MKCIECDKPAEYIRYTQFSGDHPYCKDCAEQEDDFHNEGDSYSFWDDIDNGDY